MKTKKKMIALCTIVAILVGMLSIFATTAGAATATPTLSFEACALSFRDSVCIKYAVAAEDATDVTVLVWNEPQSEYVVGTQDAQLTKADDDTVNGKDCQIFDYTQLAAKQMTDVVYARAYTNVDGVAYYSEINKYSILQYAYNMLGKTDKKASTEENLKTMLTDMLSYGASAQKYFAYNTDRLATDDFYQVKVSGGLLDDQCTHGLYLPGDVVTMTAPATDAAGTPFSHWEDSKNNKVGLTATYELTVGNQNEEYTAVYAKTSVGLEFDSNGDGTCYLIGIGECTDTELIIPATSPDGDTVIGIDSSAFAGEAIVSVAIPNTVEAIGRRAFNNCTSLTDVYYDGTAEEWANIDINATGNDALVNATIHYSKVTTYTVIFKDYDGTTLKTETVNSGADATAPADPSRDGYTFTGWDKDYTNVTADLTVTAQYTTTITEPTLMVESVTANAGESVQVPVVIKNNPGVAGAIITITYDSALTLSTADAGEAFAFLQYTQPGLLSTPCNFTWDSESGETKEDGTIVYLTFEVPATAQAGDTFEINCSYRNGDIFNDNWEDVTFEMIGGKITVN